MDRLLQDLRQGLRRIRNNPGFAFIAVLTLALGIGANTAIFSAINAILLRPLPVVDSSRLVTVNSVIAGNTFPTFSYPNYRDIRDRSNSVLAGVAAYRFLPASFGYRGESQRIWGYLVSGNYFQMLGVKPALGRLFTPEDDIKEGAHPLAILTYASWKKRLGGDPNAIGKTVKINSKDYTIVGVLPREFWGTELFYMPEIFFPMHMQKDLEGGSGYLERRGTSNIFTIARLAPGVTTLQAESALASVAHQLAEEYPKDNGGMKIVLTPPGLAGAMIRGPVIAFATALFGLSTMVLLVACTNLASMLLARGSDRRKETAIRLAIGAGRGRLIRQLLTENLVLALLGGVCGALLALWITESLANWRIGVDLPLILSVSADYRVFVFALVISAFTTILFGMLPAWQSTKTDLVPALKNEATSERTRHWHVRDYLVATQIGLSALLLVCSVLVVKSLQRAMEAPFGYQPKGAVTTSYDLNLSGYDENRGREFHRRLLEKVRATPGVDYAALADWLPLSVNNNNDSIFIQGKPVPKSNEAPIAYSFSVSPDFFESMGTRLLAGRAFTLRDNKDAPLTAVVNQAFVDQLLPGEQPLGKRFGFGPEGPWLEIIGVVETGKYFSLTEDRRPAVFTSLERRYSANVSLVARTSAGEQGILRAVKQTIAELDPNVALYSSGTMTEMLDMPLFPARLAAGALGAFGLLAAILAAAGIYGIMAYSVSRRAREIGIRIAIGANASQVLTVIARRAAILIGAGTILGLAAAWFVGRQLGAILYGVNATDPLTYALVLVMMLAIAALACFVPARRAMRIDPITSLRQE